MEWKYDGSTGVWSRTYDMGPFSLLQKIEVAYEIDLSQYRGRFTNEREEGAIPCAYEDYNYFVPLKKLEDRIKDYMELGYSKVQATIQAKKDIRRDAFISTGNSSVQAYYLTTKAYLIGMKLGTASFAVEIEGIPVEDTECLEQVNETANEAIEEAKRNLAVLKTIEI